jgi:hypothetical protein
MMGYWENNVDIYVGTFPGTKPIYSAFAGYDPLSEVSQQVASFSPVFDGKRQDFPADFQIKTTGSAAVDAQNIGTVWMFDQQQEVVKEYNGTCPRICGG